MHFFSKGYAVFDLKIFFQTTNTYYTSFLLLGAYFIYQKVFILSF